MANILSTGISALNAFQLQLNTTGHNIANVNTPGYSRQLVDLGTNQPNYLGTVGYIGTGVEVTGINRVYDQFLAEQVRSFTSAQEEYRVLSERASQIDNVIADTDTGVDESLQSFFEAVQDLAADPYSIPARSVVLNRAEQLADRFQSLNAWMEDLGDQVNRDMNNHVSEINSIATSIAQLNTTIQQTGAPSNDLLDQRDQLVDELSQYVNVTTVEQTDGSLNVFIGSGQGLVVGTNSNSLSVVNNPLASDRKELAIETANGTSVVITEQLNGGKLGGLLRFRDEVLSPTQNSLGLMAIGLADSFNAEHITGMDLDGELGTELFAVAEPLVTGLTSNSGTLSASFDNVSDLNGHEYELTYDGANWNITDQTTNLTTVLGAAGPFVFEGLSIDPGPGAAAGDTYLLRPTQRGAASIETLISDPRDLAAAEAVSASESSSNTGTGHISQSAQTTSSGTSLAALPITLTYDAVAGEFTYPPAGSISYNPATDTGSTLSLAIPGLGDFSFTMTGSPADGDQFTFGDNTGATGDNRNALRLAGLQNQPTMFGDTATLADVYGRMVADVGTQSHLAASNASVQAQLLLQAETAKASVSGVNLDEEAANLVRYQQAYTAAAQVISTASTLFDTLIGAVRR